VLAALAARQFRAQIFRHAERVDQPPYELAELPDVLGVELAQNVRPEHRVFIALLGKRLQLRMSGHGLSDPTVNELLRVVVMTVDGVTLGVS
jgi:hypothetical protein